MERREEFPGGFRYKQINWTNCNHLYCWESGMDVCPGVPGVPYSECRTFAKTWSLIRDKWREKIIHFPLNFILKGWYSVHLWNIISLSTWKYYFSSSLNLWPEDINVRVQRVRRMHALLAELSALHCCSRSWSVRSRATRRNQYWQSEMSVFILCCRIILS